ncbi:YbhB/YbcL family Raf kinase inhibitor-like protein [Sulfurimonas sp. HSL1-2]|uniref:YbhB/YbcL family Raf kinase inhibitor-like protein n=1 Tax=Thiomicrolovo zhangzhouensis TaxID=3131933 RepID=UPI0031F743E7
MKVLTGLLLLAATWLYAGNFTLKSSDLQGQLTMKEVFNGFGCSGQNVSPSLNWEGAPEGTKSFAVTVYDPDAPTGSGWWHWVVFNLPATVTSLPSGAGNDAKGLPKGAVQSMTSFGQAGFGGACPPVGDRPHRYVFTVYALDVAELDLDASAMPALVGYMLNAHAVAKASLMAYYGR